MSELMRPKFGNRFLKDEANVFQHNAWDNVQWTEEQEEEAKTITEKHSKVAAFKEEKQELLSDASKYWNKFYDKHDNKFFKDRHWLFTEFPELLNVKARSDCAVETEQQTACKKLVNATENDSSSTSDPENVAHFESNFPGCCNGFRLLEIGCGAGNTIFPVLKVNSSKDLFVYCCDYSSSAVNIVKTHDEYDTARCHVFVHDITSTETYPFPEQSLDIVVMIFVLSALQFSKMQDAIDRIAKLLKPGGLILFRDYGRYDLAQLRFKSDRCLSENFYSRGDGTLVYFFTQEEVRQLFTKAGLVEEQNLVDRRLQVNRAKQIKMYRVWVQAKYSKPL